MEFSLSILLLSAIAGICASTPIPKGTSAAGINIFNHGELRIYYQDKRSSGISEIVTGLPTALVGEETLIFSGATRANTPLAALSWVDSGDTVPNVSRAIAFILVNNTRLGGPQGCIN